MIRMATQPKSAAPEWHQVFLKLAPAIEAHARLSFRHLRPEARAEAVQTALCSACAAIARLAGLNKLELCYPSMLARFAVAQTRAGRMLGRSVNCKDVASAYCQRAKGIVLQRLDHFDDEENQWQEAVVQDTRLAPVPDIVAFRVDFADWLAGLPRRNRRIAQFLALNHRTTDTARRFGMNEGRISQLRRELAASWHQFVGDVPAKAAVPA